MKIKELLVGSVVGAIVSLIMTAVFQEKFNEVVDRIKLSIRRGLYRLRGKRPTVPTPEEFTIAGKVLPFYVVDGDGERAYKPDTIICQLDESTLALPPEVHARRKEIENREASSKAAGQHTNWNGPLYTLARYAISRTIPLEEPELRLVLQRTDYFTFQATVMRLDQPFEDGSTLRAKYLQSTPTELVPFLAAGFGVAMVLVTQDEKVILSRRHHNAGARPGQLDVSFVEGVHPDLDRAATSLAPDLFNTAIRGAREEVGVEIFEPDIRFLGFGVDLEYYQWNVLGMARLPVTAAAALSHRSRGISGKWETRTFEVIDFRPADVWQFLAGEELWATGWAALYWCLVREYGRKRVTDEAPLIWHLARS